MPEHSVYISGIRLHSLPPGEMRYSFLKMNGGQDENRFVPLFQNVNGILTVANRIQVHEEELDTRYAIHGATLDDPLKKAIENANEGIEIYQRGRQKRFKRINSLPEEVSIIIMPLHYLKSEVTYDRHEVNELLNGPDTEIDKINPYVKGRILYVPFVRQSMPENGQLPLIFDRKDEVSELTFI